VQGSDASPSSPEGHLELRGVSLELGGQKVLDGLDLDFWLGHVHALIGPNGAGKSTLANTIMGLPGYRGHEGQILLDGRLLNPLGVAERAALGITLGWQEPARYEGLKVRDFILAGAKEKTPDTVESSLERVGLSAERYADRAVDRTLSGGERKRIELASILAMEPRIVLMDEPDSGIDIEALQRIFDAIDALRRSGATIILITHSLTVLRRAEHAFLFCCGRLIDKGSVDRIASYFEEDCIPCPSHDGDCRELEAATT
jgi:Fe-S cluster assembly ATP-binding protein